jgi:long-chain acyl-CoA synthetase
VPTTANLTDAIFDNAAYHGADIAFRRPRGAGWYDVTAAQFRDEVVALAKGLISGGVGPGDRVALLSRTRYEWTLADYAIWTAGAVSVPVYDTSAPDQIAWILEDSGAVAIIVETSVHADRVKALEAEGRIHGVRHVWTIEDGSLDRLCESGKGIADDEVEQRRHRLDTSSLATVLYTSGTTGRPKGCELTHGNFLFGASESLSALRELFEGPSSTLLFLPLAHVFARVIQVAVVMARKPLGHSPDARNVAADLASFSPTFILAVPYGFERIYNTAQQKAAAEGKSRIFAAAVRTAIAYSEALDAGRPSIGLRLRRAIFDKIVYGRIRAALGGRVRYAVSGGAPLGSRLGHFFRGVGVLVLEGYGLTETTAGTAVNKVSACKIGTVGRPLGGTSARISDDGELLVRGDHVFRGYWHNPEGTADAMEDGWFHTGDLGEIDDDGFVHITGRKKEILVTSGGKNVVPAPLEDRIRAHYLVSQCVVVGDARSYVACLLSLDRDALTTWKTQHNKPAGMSIEELRSDADLTAEIQSVIDDANTGVSRAESIRRFRIVDADLTPENGLLTPTLKVKRAIVLAALADDVEALYR